jgi:protein-tyrosine sulfotransferase
MTRRRMKTLFIIGIMPRSGTNYLYNLLALHPACGKHPALGEDFLLSRSARLCLYAREVRASWAPDWQAAMGSEDRLYALFGDALQEYLRTTPEAGDRPPGPILLAKTPCVTGLENFFRFFPREKLLLVVRDGRSVIESGMRSFGWNFEEALHRYARSARAILDFAQQWPARADRFKIVRYEDLFLATTERMKEILSFLELDAARYDFDAARHLGVVGSSELAASGKSVHWREEPRAASFNPDERWRDWSLARRRRFYHVAGREFDALGYTEEDAVVRGESALRRLRHRLLDLHWKGARLCRYVHRGLASIQWKPSL